MKTNITFLFALLSSLCFAQQAVELTAHSITKEYAVATQVEYTASGGRSTLISASNSALYQTIKEKKEETYNLYVFPNPTAEQVTLQIPGLAKPAVAKAYGIDGSLLLEQNLNAPTTRLNLSAFAKGIYIIHVFVEGELAASEKLLVK